MSDERPFLEGAPPEQIEAHARAVMLQSAVELRRLENRLADLSALLPDPSTVSVRRRGVLKREFASDEERPPTVLEAQLGAVEHAIEQLGSSIGILTDTAEISIDALVRSWRSRRDADRRAGVALLVRSLSVRQRRIVR